MEYHIQNLKDKELSWEKLHSYHPAEVVTLFRKIVDNLRPLISGCNLLVVGSFSDGTAKYFHSEKGIQYFSDIDLLLVVPDKIKDILDRRDIISSRLNLLSSCLETTHGRFHIGLRYRFSSELPDFALKCESLGYKFVKHALTIFANYTIKLETSKTKFTLGHTSENLCSKLWAIIRYINLDFSNKANNRYYIQTINRANSCMNATLAYSIRELYTKISIDNLCKNSTDVHTLDNHILEILTNYSSTVSKLVKINRNLCISISENDEFDFFRVSNGKPEILADILLLLLELIRDAYLNKNDENKLSYFYEYAKIINLGEETSLHNLLYTRNIYYSIRYKIAEKRITLSPLFKRDRGPKFLASLKKPAIGR